MTVIERLRTCVEVTELDGEIDHPAPVKAGVEVAHRHRISYLGNRLAARWIPILLTAWIVIFSLGVALEPDAATNDESVLDAVFGGTLLISWAVMIGGLVQRRRYAALASAAGAACLVVMTFTCPLSGHHTAIGGWWWFQLAGSLTLLGLSRQAVAEPGTGHRERAW